MTDPTDGAANAPGDGQGAATTPDEGGNASWLESLSEAETFTIKGEDGTEKAIPLREHPKLKEFKSPEEMAKSLLNQEKLLGKKVIGLAPLKPGATDEEKAAWDKEFRTVMGVPEKPEDYVLPIPEGMPIHDGFKNWFLKSAHENGMSPAQVERQVSSYAAWATEMMKEQEEAAQKELEEAKRTTAAEATKLFGGEAQATEAVELAKRGFSTVCARAKIEPEKAEAIAKSLGDDLTLVQIFHYIGKNTSQEDSNHEGSGGVGAQEETRREKYEKQFSGS